MQISQLSESLNRISTSGTYSSEEEYKKNQAAFRGRLSEVRRVIDDIVSGRSQEKAKVTAYTYQFYLHNQINKLAGEVPAKEWDLFFGGTVKRYLLSSKLMLLSALNDELRQLVDGYTLLVDTHLEMPAFTRVSFFHFYSSQVEDLLSKVHQQLRDKELCGIIDSFFRSFSYRTTNMVYTYEDRLAFWKMFGLLFPVLGGEGTDKSEATVDMLKCHGFNYPAFVSYRITSFHQRQPDCAEDIRKGLVSLHLLQAGSLVAADNSLALAQYPSLSELFNSWINKQLEVCTRIEEFDKAVEKRVAQRINSLKINTRLTVRELGQMVHAFVELKIFNGKKKQFVDLFSSVFACNKAEDIAEHSFENALYSKDQKVASTLIAWLEKVIQEVRRRADL